VEPTASKSDEPPSTLAQKDPPKDKRVLALVFINIFAITGTAQGVIFKLASRRGASILDYMAFRNILIGLIAAA